MGNNNSKQAMPKLTNEMIAECIKISHFNEDEVKKLYKRFEIIAQSQIHDGVVDIGEFQQALGIESRGFAHRIFNAFDKNSSLTIEFKEFVNSLSVMCPKATVDEKAKFIFKVYDKNGDGDITKEELSEILEFSLSENKAVHLTPQQIEQVVNSTFKQFDNDKSGAITLDEFLKAANQNPSILNCVSLNYNTLMGE